MSTKQPTFDSLTEDVDLNFEGSFEGDSSSFPALGQYGNNNFEESVKSNDAEVSFRETNDGDDSSSMLIDQLPNHSFWKMEYYAVFFNVSTKTILSRLWRSVLPIGGRGSFYTHTEIPDLYGPFWVVTTLVVILAITANLASYIHFLPTTEHVAWVYDFEKVTVAASVFYTMISIVPLCVWLYLKRELGVSGSIPWLGHIISIYGYSFTIYIPAAVMCITPMELVRWITVFVSCVISLLFVTRNVWSYMPTNNVDWSTKTKAKGSVLIIAIAVIHIGVAFATKFYFFHYLTALETDIATSAATGASPTAVPVMSPTALVNAITKALTPTSIAAPPSAASALVPPPKSAAMIPPPPLGTATEGGGNA